MERRVYIAGCPIDRISLDEITEIVCRSISKRDRCQVLGPNAAFVVDAWRDRGYRALLESTTYLPADGFWVTIAAKMLGYRGVAHVGIERLVYALLPRLAQRKVGVYLLGAREHIVKKAALAIEERYKGIKIVGCRNGYFGQGDEDEVLANINGAEPDLILVGMGSPKRETWMHRYKDRLNASVVIGVGGLFDVIAGAIPAAPAWMKDHGLEWLFRFWHDPVRLWRRYTVSNALFIFVVGKQWVTTRSPLRILF